MSGNNRRHLVSNLAADASKISHTLCLVLSAEARGFAVVAIVRPDLACRHFTSSVYIGRTKGTISVVCVLGGKGKRYDLITRQE